MTRRGPLNVLVINPPSEHTIPEYADDRGRGYLEPREYGVFPPLGALYVLSQAETELPHHRYHFLDCPSENLSHAKLKALLARLRPDLVGISSYTISIIDAIRVAESVRATSPSAHICLGGHHSTAFPVEAAALPQFDSIVAGEGEHAFTALLRCLESGRDFTAIRGLYTQDSVGRGLSAAAENTNRYLSRPSIPFGFVDDVDGLAVPNRRHILRTNYRSIVGRTNRLATMLSSRGCPFSCTFCDNPYKSYRRRNPAAVIDEIRACLRLGYREIHFYDELFNVSPQQLTEFADALLAAGINVPWSFRGRIDALSFEALARARRAGLRMISLGVETGSTEGLRRIRKGFKIEQTEQVFAWCRRLGILTVAYFMIGLPHERSANDVRRSVQFLIKLTPDYAMISILNLYPHTPLTHEAVERGFLPENYWESFARAPSPDFRVRHWTEFLTSEELSRLHRESYRRFYLRPAYVWQSLTSIRSTYEVMTRIQGLFKLR